MLELMKAAVRAHPVVSAVESRRRVDEINTEHNAQVPEEENENTEVNEETMRLLNDMNMDIGFPDDEDDWGTDGDMSEFDYGSVMGDSDEERDEDEQAKLRDGSRGRSRAPMGS
jgi:hypothetical protein